MLWQASDDGGGGLENLVARARRFGWEVAPRGAPQRRSFAAAAPAEARPLRMAPSRVGSAQWSLSLRVRPWTACCPSLLGRFRWSSNCPRQSSDSLRRLLAVFGGFSWSSARRPGGCDLHVVHDRTPGVRSGLSPDSWIEEQ
ncbi:unnamed protein product [Prorocentrum cordatum]|uniref:Uncharacterized protein n=1 Tax=Prorocentrum cordatum TaxID=2364126 RepID=A0ABN9VEB1_9DINO|nr:unnamed protein product [Polarella glacialis]